jgi:signal transduction histidine kinase
VPAQPVRLGKQTADELTAAVLAALDNVRQHCGAQAHAWVLVEDEPGLVTVTIRDDGPGIPDGRLRNLGGCATISSVSGEGTEVELRLPRPAPAPRPAARRPAADRVRAWGRTRQSG